MPDATSLIMFALPIFMPRLTSIIFYQNSPKIKLFLPKKGIILERWGLHPQAPKTAPLIANFWLCASSHVRNVVV